MDDLSHTQPRDHAEEYNVMDFFARLWKRSRTVFACGLFFAWITAIYLLIFIKPYTAEALIRLDAELSPKGEEARVSSEIDFIRSRSMFLMTLDAMGPSVDIIATESPLKSMLRKALGRPQMHIFSSAQPGLHITKLQVPERFLNQSLALKIEAKNHYSLFDANDRLIFSDVLPADDPGFTQPGTALQPIQLQITDIHVPEGSRFTLIPRSPKNLIASLQRQLKAQAVSRSENARFMHLSFSGDNAAFTKRFLNTLVNTYLKRAYEFSAQGKLRALDNMAGQLKTLKAKLETAESNLKDFQQQSGMMDITAEMQFALQQVMDLETQIRTIKAKQRELAAYYTPAHPSQLALSEQLQFLSGDLAAKQAFIERLPETQRQLLQYMREVETYKQMYQLTSEKYTDLSNEAASITGYATLVDSPEIIPGSGLVFFVKNVIAGFVLGCIIGTVMVYVVYLSPFASLRVSSQISNLTSLPVLGTLARIPTFSLRLSRKQKRIMPLILGGQIDPNIFQDFFVLMKNLGFATFGAPNSVVMITGNSGHAPAVVAANIASMYAKLNKTLLIDGSMLERGIHRYLQTPNEPGLSDVMIGKAQPDEAVRNLDKNLYFLPGGTATSYGPHLLMQGLFIDMLKEFGKTFRYIVLYYPTIRDEQINSDLMNYVGSIIPVISAGQKIERVRQSLATLQIRPNVKGIILDDVTRG